MSSNVAKIQIIADDRESKSAVISKLQAMENVCVCIKRLAIGDYKVDNRLLFEKKTLKDLAVSIIDGRLFNQMIRLAGTSLKSVLILEGTGKDLADSGMHREAIQGALITITLIMGIPLLRSKEPDETARLMVYAARQMKSFVRGGLRRYGYRPKDKRKRQLFILQGLPGIGREKAIRLLDNFGSVAAIVAASSNELQAVEGIGQILAEKIKWTVSEEIAVYGYDEDFPL
jgi:DNA excision repair protein ERCC-4